MVISTNPKSNCNTEVECIKLIAGMAYLSLLFYVAFIYCMFFFVYKNWTLWENRSHKSMGPSLCKYTDSIEVEADCLILNEHLIGRHLPQNRD